MHPHRSSFIRLTSLRTGENDIYQNGYLFFIQAEIRHIRHRMPDREHQFPGCFPDSRTIKARRKAIPATSADMAASAGQPVHQALPLSDLRSIAEGKTGIFPCTQPGVSNVFTLRRRITSMAESASATLRIMTRMA